MKGSEQQRIRHINGTAIIDSTAGLFVFDIGRQH